MRRCVGAPVVLLGVLGLASLGACGEDSPTSAPAVRVGPVRAGYEGPAFPVPQEPEVDGRANMVVAQREDGAIEYLPAGEPVDVVVAAAGGEDAVSIALEDGETATADSVDFWVMPAFVELKNLDVTVDGTTTTLGDSDVVYHRETTSLYDDPATPEFEGICRRAREFLACVVDTWSIGQQTFTVDLVEMGVAKRDREMIAHGIKGLEWGMARRLNDEAIHELSRDCDGQTSADFGYTHHSTQWLESMGRAVYLLASSEYAGEYRETIDALIDRIRTLATALAESENWDLWVSQIEQKESGEDYTHRTFMMAAGMGLASTLADDSDDATHWENKAATIVQRGSTTNGGTGSTPRSVATTSSTRRTAPGSRRSTTRRSNPVATCRTTSRR